MAVEGWIGNEIAPTGAFVRQKNHFTSPFGPGAGELPVEAGRYRLIWSPACPWAHRQVIVRQLLGLEKVLGLGTVDPVRPDVPWSDWAFALAPGAVDPVLGVSLVSEVYKKADPDYQGRFTVPVVVDLQTGQAVNNDYFRLSNYWEVEWKKFHAPGAPNLYPEDLRADIDALNEVIFQEVNNGVYRVGFAQTQESYDQAFDVLFARLDELERRLESRRFLFGDFITDSDVRLYVTLARFDVAYYNGFKANRNRLAEFPHLWAYSRDLYQTPGFGDTTQFEAIKKHYHLCAIPDNPFKLVPKGPDLSGWNVPHGRESLSSVPGRKFREAQ
jgi:putative glutathione S-transferase